MSSEDEGATGSAGAKTTSEDVVEDNSNISMDVAAELPFLVTSWLAEFGKAQATDPQSSHLDGVTRQAELDRVRHAASELARAFSALGAFGSASRPLLSSGQMMLLEPPEPQPATFADARRRWSTCPPDQLAHLVEAATLNNATIDSVAQTSSVTNLLQASSESIANQSRNPESGRTLDEAIDLGADPNATRVPRALSSLQPSVILRGKRIPTKPEERTTEPSSGRTMFNLASEFAERSHAAAAAVRRFLELREKFRRDDEQIRSLKRSVAFQNDARSELDKRRSQILATNGEMELATKLDALEEVKEGQANCDRVISQLERQLQVMDPIHAADSLDLVASERRARSAFDSVKNLMRGHRDPMREISLVPRRTNNRILFNLASRQLGFDRIMGKNIPRTMAATRTVEETRLALVMTRLSHAVTINTHLAYPVYCLRFDHTGRYFITGADDYLVRVFCLAENVNGRHCLDPSTLARGAVLVCTLRGHAGVINDINVSSDNSFLATASEDGDCRVWGLRDGSPIAILRGHVGGANMVSWSSLTPFRLVTAGADGFARVWDIREACLKRYAKFVGKRKEYRLDQPRSLTVAESTETSTAVIGVSIGAVELPPIPPAPGAPAEPAIPLPPLPPAPGGDDEEPGLINGNQDEEESGHFVANDNLDEGVKLLAKLQHGASGEELARGPGTRSRRSVKVICIARCPHGGHFATGAEDGICRVWRDEEDTRVQTADAASSRPSLAPLVAAATSRAIARMSASSQPLLTLKGHLSAVTDLQYSHAGDRLLSASQKDGVVRIWSWATDPCASRPASSALSTTGHVVKLTHVLIKLIDPRRSERSGETQQRRRPNRAASSSHVSCDVATWVCDDSRIVTSQCELVKQSGTDISEGSQFLFVWDSFTGHCLLGIAGAHSMQCPAIIPHPCDPRVFCSAGADGILKVWDGDAACCVFSHSNKVHHGPVDINDRGKSSGFLDGSFSPDGSTLVLTDDSGRAVILDCLKNWKGEDRSAPTWMREQYFANDYYDLIYDENGYCIERGSEQPPHLAPKGVRCSHGGTSYSTSVNDAFKKLVGPIPDAEDQARWDRQLVLSKAKAATDLSYKQAGNLVREFDPSTTILVQGDSSRVGLAVAPRSTVPSTQGQNNASSRPTHRLSSNWRWRDYSDILQEDAANDDDEPDSDDEEFELGERGPSSSILADSEDSDENLEAEFEESPVAVRRGSRRTFANGEDSDDDLLEFMSTNNDPTGPFVADYDAHFFRMSASFGDVFRDWLLRIESNSSYAGRKSYAPQLGDEVVYIPRAHLETITSFPSLSAPWQNWPDEAVWPVVRCCIRSIRYRFPFKAYRTRSRSIVAILSLEVTGIPELSSDPSTAWPKPTFVAPARSHVFEVKLFESDKTDFIIPVGLYTSRLNQLENALQESADGKPEVEAYYADESREDPDLLPFRGRVEEINADSEDLGDPNLLDSGYGSLLVQWEAEGTDPMSPWEIGVTGGASLDPPTRPSLTEGEKATVRNALLEVKSIANVDEVFSFPVNQNRYTDYAYRVEVPMDLSIVSSRLEADYYATRLSVVFDVRLIRDNCAKYNGDADDLTLAADEMVETFKQKVLSTEELAALNEFEETLMKNAASQVRQTETSRRNTVTAVTQRDARPRRQATTRSALERLDETEPSSVRRSRRRRRPPRLPGTPTTLESLSAHGGRTQRGVSSGAAVGRRRSNRNVSAAAHRTARSTRGSQPTLEDLSAQPGRSLRGRSNGQDGPSLRLRLRNSGQVDANGADASARRSLRSTGTRVTYADQASDVDETPVRQRAQVGEGLSRSARLLRRNSEAAQEDEPAELAESPGSESDTAPSRKRTRSTRSQLEVASEDDESVEEAQRSRSTRRSGTQSSESEEDESDAKPQAAKSRRASQRTGNESSESEDAQVSAKGRPRRGAAKADSEVSEAEAHSSDESEVVLDESSESEDLDNAVLGTTRSRRSSPGRRAAARQGKAPRRPSRRQSYADPSSSDFESDVDERPARKQNPRPVLNAQRKKAPQRSSRAAVDDDSLAESDFDSKPLARQRKRRRTSGSPNRRVKKEKFEPIQLKDWPEIDMKDITKVSEVMLERLQSIDEGDIFAIPVAEAFPSIADAYLDVVEHPMDFRTIQEERVPSYSSIRELQQDLALVFENCIRFNGASNEYAMIARNLLDMIDDIFREVCTDLDVLLPRRW